MNMSIEEIPILVTQAHIDNGIRNAAAFCPIALAIREKLNTYCEVTFDHIIIYKHEKELIKYKNDDYTIKWLLLYHERKLMSPIVIKLDNPNNILRFSTPVVPKKRLRKKLPFVLHKVSEIPTKVEISEPITPNNVPNISPKMQRALDKFKKTMKK